MPAFFKSVRSSQRSISSTLPDETAPPVKSEDGQTPQALELFMIDTSSGLANF
jgi:hypothetical protein